MLRRFPIYLLSFALLQLGSFCFARLNVRTPLSRDFLALRLLYICHALLRFSTVRYRFCAPLLGMRIFVQLLISSVQLSAVAILLLLRYETPISERRRHFDLSHSTC